MAKKFEYNPVVHGEPIAVEPVEPPRLIVAGERVQTRVNVQFTSYAGTDAIVGALNRNLLGDMNCCVQRIDKVSITEVRRTVLVLDRFNVR